MKAFFDSLIAIGIVGTLMPAFVLLYSSYKRKKSWEYKNKKTSRALGTLLLIGTSILVYGSFIEPRLLITTHQNINIEGITSPITIAFVADFQVGPYKQTAHMEHVVDRILLLNPDIVLIGGDQVDNADMDEDESIYLDPLEKLVHAGFPTYAIHGNHEYGIGGGKALKHAHHRVGDVSARVKAVLEDMGITYLVNESDTITVDSQTIAVYGGDAYWAQKLSFDALEEHDLPTIGLIHNPAAAWIAAKEDIDLILSGHTHGGQIRVPFIGPLGRVDDVIPPEWYQGLHDVDEDTQLFVTSGTGETGTRARLFNPPEVVLITLK